MEATEPTHEQRQDTDSTARNDCTDSKPGRKSDGIREHFSIPPGSVRDDKCRRIAQSCNFCHKLFNAANAKVEVLRKHLVQECRSLPAEIRRDLVSDLAGQQATKGSSVVAVPQKKRPRQADIRGAFASTVLRAPIGKAVNEHLLRWAVKSNISFRAFNSPHLRNALLLLHPGYNIPSNTTFRLDLLPREYANALAELYSILKDAANLTITFDGWTDLLKRAVLAILAAP
jgi:hypothetical protein